MGILSLTPAPGPYADPQTVTVSGPAGYTVIATDTGSDPVVVKTIASTNKLGPEYPYIQSIDDGRGRCIFDGAFVKYCNISYSASLSAPQNLFLINALNFIAKADGKKLLVLGDRTSAYTNYRVKGTDATSFNSVFTTIPQTQGYSVTIKDAADYPASDFTPSYEECMLYDAIFFMSSSDAIPASGLLTTTGAANLAAARKQGVGLYVCTDDDPFTDSANILLAAITTANFTGVYDFSPGQTVAYNKALYGDSPIFAGMADTDIVFASTSDSYVNQAITTPEVLPKSFSIPVGFTSLKFAVLDPSGNVTFEEYGYSVGVTPIIELCDESGVTLTEIAASEEKTKALYFKFVPTTEVTSVSGFIKAGPTVVGTFNNELGGVLNITWQNTAFSDALTPNEITMPRFLNRDIHVELFSPLAFTYTWSFNRVIPVLGSDSIASVLSGMNKALELPVVSQAAQTFKVIKSVVPTFTPSPSFALSYQNAYNAMTEDV